MFRRSGSPKSNFTTPHSRDRDTGRIRRLAVESLEDRRMLTTLTVTNNSGEGVQLVTSDAAHSVDVDYVNSIFADNTGAFETIFA